MSANVGVSLRICLQQVLATLSVCFSVAGGLGAGRTAPGGALDHSVGILLHKSLGKSLPYKNKFFLWC